MKKPHLVKLIYRFLCLALLAGLGPALGGGAFLAAQEQAPEAPSPAELFQSEESITFPEAPETEAPPAPGLITPWDVIRMILIFLLVLAVIYAVFRLLKKAAGPSPGNSELIKVRGSCVLSPGRTLHLVEVGREILLVGAGESAVNLVARIDDKDSLDELHFLFSTASPVPPGTSFQDWLNRVLNRKGGGPGGGGIEKTMTKNKDFLSRQRDRLKKM
ncbi:MAG: flagellar biosynthetic protein FliO [Spirochaetales bacterium]|nr:flagellar biosynthetic protein FliO [Spirochaetales bacterium]